MSQGKSAFLQSDKNLFLRLKKHKDRAAFINAYDLYINDIYRFVFFKVNNKEEAEDITSAVFVKCWNYVRDGKLNDSNEYKSLKSFLYKIARNAVIDHYRQQKPNTDLEAAAELADQRLSLDKAAQTQFDFELVQVKLNELKTEYRAVIVMHYINELSITEIAHVLNKTKGSIRVTLHRAILALREMITQTEDKAERAQIKKSRVKLKLKNN
jgi:RNA polymerase sigma-70 factor (ECF subfamily)